MEGIMESGGDAHGLAGKRCRVGHDIVRSKSAAVAYAAGFAADAWE